MGGEGSGRKPSEETIVKRMSPEINPVGDSMFIPNYSGVQSAVLKSDINTPLKAASAVIAGLNISNSGSNVIIRKSDGTSLFMIDTVNSRLGILTDTPTAKLSFGGNAVTGIFNSTSDGSDNGVMRIGGGGGANTIRGGYANFLGNESTESEGLIKGAIQFVGGAGDSGGGMISFWTNDGVLSEKITITKAGKLGIGLTAPSAKLEVIGSISGSSVLAADGATGTFTTVDSKTITVANGIITSIV